MDFQGRGFAGLNFDGQFRGTLAATVRAESDDSYWRTAPIIERQSHNKHLRCIVIGLNGEWTYRNLQCWRSICIAKTDNCQGCDSGQTGQEKRGCTSQRIFHLVDGVSECYRGR